MNSAKRLFDIGISGVGLLLLSPVLGAIAVLIKLDSPGPVLFRQQRVGRKGEPFDIFKLRTMRHETSGKGSELTVRDDSRVTRVGRTLRHYKLDELPQLLNVLVGDMSLVGPRPEVPRYVAKWSADTKRILLSVRPGMTDLASVEFRNENALLEGSADPEAKYVKEIAPVKNRLGIRYVQSRSFLLDIKILFRTFAAILHQP